MDIKFGSVDGGEDWFDLSTAEEGFYFRFA